MVEKTLTIPFRTGLHARPVSVLVSTAMQFESEIWMLHKDGSGRADCKEIIEMMLFRGQFGEQVLLRAEGKDESAAMAAMETIFKDQVFD